MQSSMAQLEGTSRTTETPPTAPSLRRSSSEETEFFMPAEWCSHVACIMLYPHNSRTFPRLQAVRKEVLRIARTIADSSEPVIMLCHNAETASELQQELDKKQEEQRGGEDHTNKSISTTHAPSILYDNTPIDSRIHIAICPSNDTWARDTAPTFVVSRRNAALCGLDFDFNAYGGSLAGCYWPCDQDQAIASRICKKILVDFFSSLQQKEVNRFTKEDSFRCSLRPPKHRLVPLVLEGGSIHSDGQEEGTILTTEECLLHPNRNPTKSKDEIEVVLKRELGATKILWLQHGLAFDEDTNGHIDNWACFIAEAHIVLSWTDLCELDGENYHRCRQALHILESSTDAKGQSFQITKLHLPRPIFYDGLDDNISSRPSGERMAASYLNFYIANGAVLVPQFGDDHYDALAIETLAPLFSGRKVIGVYSKELLYGGGNIHCITQQVPALVTT